MSGQQVLVIEDDPAIRRGVVDALSFSGYSVIESGDGEDGLARAMQGEYDLLLLDLQLPKMDGLEILRQLRTVRTTVPVIILTARGAEDDRVKGLRLGADDYVVKPFSVKELLARIEAVLRRSAERPMEVKEINLPAGVVDLEKLEIRYSDGEVNNLSEREAELLAYLANRPGRVIRRDEILQHVWRIDAKGVHTRTIDMHIARLREKIRDKSSGADAVIQTVRGKGYVFKNQLEVGS